MQREKKTFEVFIFIGIYSDYFRKEVVFSITER